jgi:hypothetical protein
LRTTTSPERREVVEGLLFFAVKEGHVEEVGGRELRLAMESSKNKAKPLQSTPGPNPVTCRDGPRRASGGVPRSADFYRYLRFYRRYRYLRVFRRYRYLRDYPSGGFDLPLLPRPPPPSAPRAAAPRLPRRPWPVQGGMLEPAPPVWTCVSTDIYSSPRPHMSPALILCLKPSLPHLKVPVLVSKEGILFGSKGRGAR